MPEREALTFEKPDHSHGWFFGAVLLAALAANWVFVFHTTEFALSDLLGELEFLGLRWATILAFAFCGIDFAGIAHLLTPQRYIKDDHNLFFTWLFTAGLNAVLLWWGISLAMNEMPFLGNAAFSRADLLHIVPVSAAGIAFLIRLFIIGSFFAAGYRLFFGADSAKISNL